MYIVRRRIRVKARSAAEVHFGRILAFFLLTLVWSASSKAEVTEAEISQTTTNTSGVNIHIPPTPAPTIIIAKAKPFPTESPVKVAEPTVRPTSSPSSKPTNRPTSGPTAQPSTGAPTTAPTLSPSSSPSSSHPTSTPSASPTANPSAIPSTSINPTGSPTATPTKIPSAHPSTTQQPSHSPSSTPTGSPTSKPSESKEPTSSPSGSPSVAPSERPTLSLNPTSAPSHTPSSPPSTKPTISFSPTESPTRTPSSSPSTSPTTKPSAKPSSTPTTMPSGIPSPSPSARPSVQPSSAPTPICHDNKDYRNPRNPLNGCEHHQLGNSCFDYLSFGLTEDEVIELIENCPVSCNYPCEDFPVSFPTAAPTPIPLLESNTRFYLGSVSGEMDNETAAIFVNVTEQYLRSNVLGAGSRTQPGSSTVSLKSQALVDEERGRNLASQASLRVHDSTQYELERILSSSPEGETLEIELEVSAQSSFLTEKRFDTMVFESILRPKYEETLRAESRTSFFSSVEVLKERPIITQPPSPVPIEPPKKTPNVAGAVTLSIFLTLLFVGLGAGAFIFHRKRQRATLHQLHEPGDGVYSNPIPSGSSTYERDLEHGDVDDLDMSSNINNLQQPKNRQMRGSGVSTGAHNSTDINPRIRSVETNVPHRQGVMIHSTSTCKEGAEFTFNVATLTNMESSSRASSNSSVNFFEQQNNLYPQYVNMLPGFQNQQGGDAYYNGIPPMIVIESLEDAMNGGDNNAYGENQDEDASSPNNIKQLHQDAVGRTESDSSPARDDDNSRALVPILSDAQRTQSQDDDILQSSSSDGSEQIHMSLDFSPKHLSEKEIPSNDMVEPQESGSASSGNDGSNGSSSSTNLSSSSSSSSDESVNSTPAYHTIAPDDVMLFHRRTLSAGDLTSAKQQNLESSSSSSSSSSSNGGFQSSDAKRKQYNQHPKHKKQAPAKTLDRLVREEWTKLGLGGESIFQKTANWTNPIKGNKTKSHKRTKEDLMNSDQRQRPPRQKSNDSFNMDSNDFDTSLERPVKLARSYSDPERSSNSFLDSPILAGGLSDSPGQRSRIISHTSSLTASPCDPNTLDPQQPTSYLLSLRPSHTRQDSRGSYQGEIGYMMDSPNEFHYTFDAPIRGKLGIIIESSKDFGPTIHTVKDYSPLFGMVQPGDKIVFVEHHPTSHMGTGEITQLLARTREDKEDGMISITVSTPVEKIGIPCDAPSAARILQRQQGQLQLQQQQQQHQRQQSTASTHNSGMGHQHRGSDFDSFAKTDSLKYSAACSSSSSSDLELGSFPSAFYNEADDIDNGAGGSTGFDAETEGRRGGVSLDDSDTFNERDLLGANEGHSAQSQRSPMSRNDSLEPKTTQKGKEQKSTKSDGRTSEDDEETTQEDEFHMLGGLSNEDLNEYIQYEEDDDFY